MTHHAPNSPEPSRTRAARIIEAAFERALATSVVASAIVRADSDALYLNDQRFSELLSHELEIRSTGERGTLRFQRTPFGMNLRFESKRTGEMEFPIELEESRLAVFHDGRFNVAPLEQRLTLYHTGKVSIECGNGRRELQPKERVFLGVGTLEFEREECGWKVRYRHPADETEGEDPIQTVSIGRSGRYEFQYVLGRLMTVSYGAVRYGLDDAVTVNGRPVDLGEKVPFHCHAEGSLGIEEHSGRLFARYFEGDLLVGEAVLGPSERNCEAIVRYNSGMGLELVPSSTEPAINGRRIAASYRKWCMGQL